MNAVCALRTLKNSKTIHIKGWTVTLLQQNNNRSKKKIKRTIRKASASYVTSKKRT
jgi:hypothetical protein